MARQVLVPFDGSNRSRRALEYALAEYPDAAITAIHVLNPAEWGYNSTDSGLSKRWYEEAREESEDVCEVATALAEEHGATVSTTTENGAPGETIAEYAAERHRATVRTVAVFPVIVFRNLERVLERIGIELVVDLNARDVVFGVGKFRFRLKFVPAFQAENRRVLVAPKDRSGHPRVPIDTHDLGVRVTAPEHVVDRRDIRLVGAFLVVRGFRLVFRVAVRIELASL